MIEEITKQVRECSARMSEAIELAFNCGMAEQDAKRELEIKRYAVILQFGADPKALGVNEDARKAKLAELCEEQIIALFQAERIKAKADHELAQLRFKWESLRRLIELAAIEKGVAL